MVTCFGVAIELYKMQKALMILVEIVQFFPQNVVFGFCNEKLG